ncbi:hypothetical protein LCGC14_1085070 [marine sediment metagenome]|uniref:Uncharacterized protein n=1 Tax=marine sediment metagenome TaxID=412755 RepID=A0A0F9MIK3_9ZZZZ
MSTRQELRLDSSMMDMLVMISECNPGALNVLMQLVQKDDGLGIILDLDDMNIRGTQIWIGYKDFCGEDLGKFIEKVLARDADMVGAINREGLMGNHIHKAVVNGALFDNRELLSE